MKWLFRDVASTRRSITAAPWGQQPLFRTFLLFFLSQMSQQPSFFKNSLSFFQLLSSSSAWPTQISLFQSRGFARLPRKVWRLTLCQGRCEMRWRRAESTKAIEPYSTDWKFPLVYHFPRLIFNFQFIF